MQKKKRKQNINKYSHLKHLDCFRTISTGTNCFYLLLELKLYCEQKPLHIQL